MDVNEIMSKTIVAAKPDDSVRSALTLLEDQQIRHLPVLDEGRLVGMLSDRDLREYRLPMMQELDDPKTADSLLHVPVSDVMATQVLTVDTGETVRVAIDLMLEYGVGALPVLDRHTEEMVGILSYVDILRAVREVV